MFQASPGVERAFTAARLWADRCGAGQLRLSDLLLGLLEEEDGRPAELINRLGLNLNEIRKSLATDAIGYDHVAPPLSVICTAARNWSLLHRADPEFLTDSVLLAILECDDAFAAKVLELGLDRRQLESLLTVDSVLDSNPPSQSSELILPDLSSDLEVGRIIDVNLNRAREALRVIEDYCRFVLNDRHLTGLSKTLRHELAVVSDRVPQQTLLAARETNRDVGTALTAEGEYERQTLRSVATANIKRLQESLRSLEEYGKLFGNDLGRQLERLRYQTYTLEKALVLGATARDRIHDARLYVLITGSQCTASMEWIIEEAAAGGADIFQLREKTLPDSELLDRARKVRAWTKKAGVLFVVNDRPDVAVLSGADGVHLGQDDLPVMEARQIVGPEMLIGVSTHNLDQVRKAVLDGADYLGVGPAFPSMTKSFENYPGLPFVADALAETSLPSFCLGGVSPENVSRVVAAGCRRIAVSAAIATANDPQTVARILRAALAE